MCDPRVIELAEEIRDLYARNCECADRANSEIIDDGELLKQRCRPRDNPDVPEAARFENVYEYSDALREFRERPEVRRRTNVVQFVNWVVVFGACLGVMYFTNSLLAIALLVVSLGGVLYFVEYRLVFRTRMRRALREQLVERGVPICITCGYDLRGLTTPRCPECGETCAPSTLTTLGEG